MVGMSAAKSLAEDCIPMLESGDRLSAREFERRYEAMPDEKRAELIEGVVFLSSPVSRTHGNSHNIMATWLGVYASKHKDVEAQTDTSVRLDTDNLFQPDIFLWRASGGGAQIGDKDLIDGAPELVVEIALSSASRDLYAKKHVYRRTGVREYIVWRVLDDEVDWFELRDGEYIARRPDGAGIIESGVFLGLRLNVAALLAGDVAAVLAGIR